MALSSTDPRRVVDLALQGGGSHGAFTWGVLDRLLEDASLGIDGVSGTSAGALNAAVMATGLARGGGQGAAARRAAREALAAFWLDVAGAACFGGPAGGTGVQALAPFNPFDPVAWLRPWQGIGAYNLDTLPFYGWAQQWLRAFTPAQLNPLGLNRLREVVGRHVDTALLERAPIELFVTATSVRTGRPRVFDRHDLTLEALLASASLPHLFPAVTIDGEAWWDGGYTGNPSIWPLVYETDALDIVLVKINPLRRERLPQSALDIADRVAEISFSAGVTSEMRAIDFVQRLLREGRVDPGRYKDLRLHMVADDAGLAPLAPSSKLNTDPRFLRELHALGRAAAERWLGAEGRQVGLAQTLDIAEVFLGPKRQPSGLPSRGAGTEGAGTRAAARRR